MSKGLLTALLLSIVLAISLSLLPEKALDRLGGSTVTVDPKRDVPVMKMDGLVDQLGTLSLTGHLQKINQTGDKLTVWLVVPRQKLNEQRPWNDIYQIAHRFLAEVPQYKQVEVRVVASDRPQEVALAVIADRSMMAHAPAIGSPQVASFVQQNLNVIEAAPK